MSFFTNNCTKQVSTLVNVLMNYKNEDLSMFLVSIGLAPEFAFNAIRKEAGVFSTYAKYQNLQKFFIESKYNYLKDLYPTNLNELVSNLNQDSYFFTRYVEFLDLSFDKKNILTGLFRMLCSSDKNKFDQVYNILFSQSMPVQPFQQPVQQPFQQPFQQPVQQYVQQPVSSTMDDYALMSLLLKQYNNMDKKGCKKKRDNCDKESNCKLAKLDSNSEEIDKSLKQFVEYQEHLNRLYENLSSVVKKPPPQSSYIIEMPSQIVQPSQSPPVRFISPGLVPTLPQNQPLVPPQTQLVVARYGSKRKRRRSKAHKKAHKKTHKRRSRTKK